MTNPSHNLLRFLKGCLSHYPEKGGDQKETRTVTLSNGSNCMALQNYSRYCRLTPDPATRGSLIDGKRRRFSAGI